MIIQDRALLSFIPFKILVELQPSTKYTIEFNASSEKDIDIQIQFISYLKFRPIADIIHHQGIRQRITRGTNSYKCELATHNFNATDKTEHYLIIAAVEPHNTYITFSGIGVDRTDTLLKFIVLWLGRNSIEKSPSLMVKIANNIQNIRVIMNVPGGNRHNLKMLGRVSDDEVNRLYDACDIFCSTAVWPEPAGLTILEAQAHGKPVIALNRGAIREYTAEKGRILVDASADGEVARMSEVLSILTKEELHTMGQEAQKFVRQNFNYTVMGKNYLTLYKQIAGIK